MNFPHIAEIEIFSNFLYQIRTFFRNKKFIEVETPLLNPFTTPEPYIDSFQVCSEDPLYLITSPEFNLKTLISKYQKNVFQIAHVFRKGDQSSYHTHEFLMLEWYHIGIDEMEMIKEVQELLLFLEEKIDSFSQIQNFQIKSMQEIFKERLGTDFSRNSLIAIIREKNLVDKKQISFLEKESYDELFFRVFLTLIEPELNTRQPLFIYGYPEPLRAYSKLRKEQPDVSSRFELYWKNMEIANGYREITKKEEQIEQFKKEQQRRIQLNKSVPMISKSFLQSFPLPDCSGVSIGLERLFMAFRDLNRITEISFC